jgi:hypothetical protein
MRPLLPEFLHVNPISVPPREPIEEEPVIDIWDVKYQQFLDDSVTIRGSTDDQKTAFFDRYNSDVAPLLKTVGAAFNTWANLLAAVHPPTGTRVVLKLEAATDYAEVYQFAETVVSYAADTVFHLLVPSGDSALNARAILLFRGTALIPASFDDGECTEPQGFWADTNVGSVGSVSFWIIQHKVQELLRHQAAQERAVTFVGQSLGGNLALRALNQNFKDNNPLWHLSEVYIYSSVGVDIFSANHIHRAFEDRRAQLHAYWHKDDWITKTGHFPVMMGHEWSEQSEVDPDAPPKPYHDLTQCHTLPFASIEVGWGQSLCYTTPRERPSYSTVGEFARNLARQLLFGIPATVVYIVAWLKEGMHVLWGVHLNALAC